MINISPIELSLDGLHVGIKDKQGGLAFLHVSP